MGFKTSSPWLKSVEGKHVLITGGSTGIGFAIAKEALSQGAFITLIARSSSKLEKAAEILAKHCGNADKICSKIADVGEYESVAKAIKESFEWRPIDVLVCNAAVAKSGIMDETRIEDQHAIIQTNFTGVFNTLHAGLPLMKKRSAQTPMSVVIISSLSGLRSKTIVQSSVPSHRILLVFSFSTIQTMSQLELRCKSYGFHKFCHQL